MKTQFKKGASWRDENGMYTWDGRKFPSVTTVLAPHSDFLWVHINEISNVVNKLSNMIDTGEMWEMWVQEDESWSKRFVDPAVALRDGKHISNVGFRFLKACANRGSLIHELVTDYATGAAGDNMGERCEELIYSNQYACAVDDCIPFAESLWKWLDDKKPEIMMSEVPVFNETEGYAGTCDGVMYLNGELICFDAKTQKSYSASRSHFAQIGAYSNAEFVANDIELNISSDMPKVDGSPMKCGILYVTPEKTGLRYVGNSEWYYHNLFLPSLKAFNAFKYGEMPDRKVEWVA